LAAGFAGASIVAGGSFGAVSHSWWRGLTGTTPSGPPTFTTTEPFPHNPTPGRGFVICERIGRHGRFRFSTRIVAQQKLEGFLRRDSRIGSCIVIGHGRGRHLGWRIGVGNPHNFGPGPVMTDTTTTTSTTTTTTSGGGFQGFGRGGQGGQGDGQGGSGSGGWGFGGSGSNGSGGSGSGGFGASFGHHGHHGGR
jgi:hypothetical protein